MEKNTIASIIKELNTDASGFAKMLGVSRQNVYHWLSGRNLPGKSSRKMICKTLNISEAQLVSGTLTLDPLGLAPKEPHQILNNTGRGTERVVQIILDGDLEFSCIGVGKDIHMRIAPRQVPGK